MLVGNKPKAVCVTIEPAENGFIVNAYEGAYPPWAASASPSRIVQTGQPYVFENIFSLKEFLSETYFPEGDQRP